MNRRQFLQLAAASGAVTLLPAALKDSLGAEDKKAPPKAALKGQESLHFLIFGDWGSGAKLQKEVAAALATYCEKAKKAKNPVAFAVSTGDNFYDRGVTDNEDEQWKTKFEQMYPQKAMNFPFFAVLGNHDWVANPTTQFSYRGPSGRWRMDGFYYKVAQRNGLADFFFFDSDLWLPQYNAKGLGDKQLKWLQKSLDESTAQWKFLIGHHPPYTDGIHAIEKDMMIVREILTPLCKEHKVDALFSGHDHDLQHIQIPDMKTHFVISGAAGAGMRPRATHNFGPFYQDLTGGFLAVELKEKTMKARFIASDARVLHDWTQVPV